MLKRRGLLTGLGAALFAPAIIRTPGLLMPIRPRLLYSPFFITAESWWAEGLLIPKDFLRYEGQRDDADDLMARIRRVNILTPAQSPPLRA